jgi:hypothetical protein
MAKVALEIFNAAAQTILDLAPPLSPVIPARRIPLKLGLDHHWRPAILVVGGPLPPLDEVRLQRHGCEVEVVHQLGSALARLIGKPWDVVAIHPTIKSEGDGVRFVRSFKGIVPELLPDEVSPIVHQYACTPFVVLPLQGDSEFAVFRTIHECTIDGEQCAASRLSMSAVVHGRATIHTSAASR